MYSRARSRHRHLPLARRFVGDHRVIGNLVFDDRNTELWWFLTDELYFISSKSNPTRFLLKVGVFIIATYTDIVDPPRGFRPSVDELHTAAALQTSIKRVDDFKRVQSEKIPGTTAFKKGGLWEWEAKRIVPITASNAGFTQPIQRAMPNMENLSSFELSSTSRGFLYGTLPRDDAERVSLLSDLALAAAGRIDRLAATLFFIGPPRTGKTTFLECVKATFGESVGTFDVSEALAYSGHGAPAARQQWKKDLEFKNIAVCDEPAQHGRMHEGPMTFAGQAIKTLCPRVLSRTVTVQATPPPHTCAHLQPHVVPASPLTPATFAGCHKTH